MSKIGTLAASVGAGLCGSAFLLRRGKKDAPVTALEELTTVTNHKSGPIRPMQGVEQAPPEPQKQIVRRLTCR